MSLTIFIPFLNMASSAEKIHGEGAVAVEESAAAIMWLVVLLVMVLFGGFVALAIRKRYRSLDDEALPSVFNLETLRKMKERGELTEEEFRKACDHLHRDVLPDETATTSHQSDQSS
ncbi:MAG: hypothetical protein CMJ40_01275 [Phycisphaerae bacterium]|nr:hypothetical protein [Phycisphaerae bacterium]